MKNGKLLCALAAFTIMSCPVETDGNFNGEIRGYRGGALPAPTNVRAEAPDNAPGTIVIRWNKVDDADGYNIYRSKGGSAPSLRGGAGDVVFTDKGKSVAPDIPYAYFVSAYKGEQESELSPASPKAVTLEIGADGILSAPDSVNADRTGTNAVKLTWSEVSGAAGYYIYRSSSYDDKQYIFKHESTVPTYTDSNLAAGDYTYQVSAVNAQREEGYISSASDTVTIPPDPNAPTVPVRPENLNARIETEGTLAITLHWEAAANTTKYQILRSEDGETYREIGFADGVTSYTDRAEGENPIDWGMSYYYRVKPFNGTQEGYLSKPSGPVVIKPAKPVIMGIWGMAGNLTIRWTIAGSANGFKVYRSVDNERFVLIKTATGEADEYRDTTVPIGVYYYRVIAYNSGGESLHSESYEKDVKEEDDSSAEQPVMSVHPVGGNYTLGASVTLSLSASVSDGGTLSYQWYRNTVNSTTGGTPVGNNSNSCSFTAETVGTRYYYAKVTNTNNNAGITTVSAISNTAEVIVTGIGASIVINLGGVNEAELVNPAADLSANTDTAFTANGTYTSYQWYLDGTAVSGARTYTFNQGPGKYELAVVVNSATGKRSGRCRITVE
jgi:fibronectin type 3 domain-containing protein